MIILRFLCLFSLLWAGAAQAAIYYAAPNGNPGVSCQTATNPNSPRTVATGINCLSPGDTLYLRGGTYSNLRLGEGGTGPLPSGTSWSNPITIASAPGEQAVLFGASAGIAMNTGQYLIFDRLEINLDVQGETAVFACCSAGHIRVQNSETWNGFPTGPNPGTGGDRGALLFQISEIPDFQMIGNRIHTGNAYGTYFSAHESLIDGNHFFNLAGYAIHMFSSGSSNVRDNIIRNNLIHHVGYGPAISGWQINGMVQMGTGPRNKFYNNIVYDSFSGLQIDYRCHDCEAYNNVFYENGLTSRGGGGGPAVGVGGNDQSINVIVQNNIFRGNASNVVQVNEGGHVLSATPNFTADPLWVNPGAADFRLQPGSPAKDAGIPISLVTTTIQNQYVSPPAVAVARPQGAGNSMGPFEFEEGGGVVPTGNPIYLSGGGHGDSPSDGAGDVQSCINAENITTPKATLAGALACMTVGGKELRIRGGGYLAAFDTLASPITGGTSWANATRITAYQNETVTLQLPVGQTVLAYLRNASTDAYIILNKLIFDAMNRPSSTAFAVVGGHHIRVIDSIIRNATAENVYLENTSDMEFTSSGQTPIMAIVNSTNYGVHVFNTITNLLIEKTLLQGNGSRALHVNLEAGTNTNTRLLRNIVSQNGVSGTVEAIGLGTGTGAQVVNNQIYRNFAGLRVYTGATGATLSNNLAANNTNRGFQCDAGATGLQWRNNLAWGNTPNPILNTCGGTLTTNMDTIDPLFTNAAADIYTLQPTSPAINAGTNLGADVPVDFNGAPRPGQPGSTGGMHYDIGPFERDSGPIQEPSGMGPLVVDATNSRYFKRPDGTLIYLTGGYDWDFLNPTMDNTSATAYLQFWADTNQNLVRAPNWDPIIFTTTDPNPPFDTAYWAFAASRVALAQSKGIYVMIPIFHFLEQLPFTDLTFCENYVQNIVDVLGGYDNVLFEVGNELSTEAHDNGTVGSFVDHIVDVIKARQVSQGHLQVPVGISEYNADAPGIEINPAVITAMMNSSADFITIGWSEVDTLQNTVLPIDRPADNKVQFVDSDHIWPYFIDHVWVWKGFMRGLNVQFLDGNEFYPNFSEDDDGNPSVPTFDARMRIGDTRAYALRMNMQLAVPSPGLSTTGWALANPGVEYLVYQPGSAAFNVTLVSGTYDVEWFDTQAQVTQNPAQVTGSGATAFTPPFDDAVLFLKAAVIPPVVANTQRVPLYMQSWFQ